MTLDQPDYRVDVRELHDRLSAHLRMVGCGAELVITRRGKAIARLSPIKATDRLGDLVQRGLVTLPERARGPRRAQVTARGSVSELIAEQRR